jgi:hypothetical protein
MKIRVVLPALFISMLGLFMASVTPTPVYAQDPLDAVCQGQGANAAICKNRTNQDPITGSSGVLTRVIQIIVAITGIASVIMIIIGGFRYITSSGDSNNINSAKNTILYAVIGLVVAIFGQAIVSFVLSRL